MAALGSLGTQLLLLVGDAAWLACFAAAGHWSRSFEAVATMEAWRGAAASEKSIIYWLHVSKSGGTWFCQCGKIAGRKGAFGRTKNCITQEEHKPAWYDLKLRKRARKWLPSFALDPRGKAKGSCTSLERALADSDFEANEGWLPRMRDQQVVGLCAQFRNIVLLREPVSRAVSFCRELWQHPLNQNNIPVNFTWPDFLRGCVNEESLVPNDNVLTRVLGGQWAFSQGFGQLNRSHFEAAMAVLHGFDDVVISDGAPAGLSLEKQVQVRLGWNCSGVVSKRDSRQSERQSIPPSLQQEVEALLERRLAFDRRLYLEGLALAERQLKRRLRAGD